MVIGDLRLLEKTGGKEDYVRPAEPARGAPARAWRGACRPAAGGPAGRAPWSPSTSAPPRASARSPPCRRSCCAWSTASRATLTPATWHRQVSLLAQESIDKMIAAGLDVGPGDFAENITTSGHRGGRPAPLHHAGLGEALVEVTQIGKECHTRCAIYHQAGDCVMPREGIFVRVLRGGRVAPGDPVRVRAWGPARWVGASVRRRRPSTERARSGRRRRVSRRAVCSRPIKAAVVTLSDKASAGLRADASGPAAAGSAARPWAPKSATPWSSPTSSVRSRATLTTLADVERCDLILTTGGTGLAPRDRTPEATRAVADRLAPGFAEAMRAASLQVTPHAMLSRAVAAVREARPSSSTCRAVPRPAGSTSRSSRPRWTTRSRHCGARPSSVRPPTKTGSRQRTARAAGLRAVA